MPSRAILFVVGVVVRHNVFSVYLLLYAICSRSMSKMSDAIMYRLCVKATSEDGRNEHTTDMQESAKRDMLNRLVSKGSNCNHCMLPDLVVSAGSGILFKE